MRKLTLTLIAAMALVVAACGPGADQPGTVPGDPAFPTPMPGDPGTMPGDPAPGDPVDPGTEAAP